MFFNTTLQQMLFLFALVIIGYVLMKFGFLPKNSETVLSKLENYLYLHLF